jgi:hypothetical protein
MDGNGSVFQSGGMSVMDGGGSVMPGGAASMGMGGQMNRMPQSVGGRSHPSGPSSGDPLSMSLESRVKELQERAMHSAPEWAIDRNGGGYRLKHNPKLLSGEMPLGGDDDDYRQQLDAELGGGDIDFKALGIEMPDGNLDDDADIDADMGEYQQRQKARARQQKMNQARQQKDREVEDE